MPVIEHTHTHTHTHTHRQLSENIVILTNKNAYVFSTSNRSKQVDTWYSIDRQTYDQASERDCSLPHQLMSRVRSLSKHRSDNRKPWSEGYQFHNLITGS